MGEGGRSQEAWERGELAYRLERFPNGLGVAEIVDRMSLNAALRQQVTRVLGEPEATNESRGL